MQDERFSHSDLYRRACRAHERKLRVAIEQALAAARGEGDVMSAATGLFESCIAAIPYAPATAFLANERGQARHAPRGRRDAARGDPRGRHRQHARRHARDRGDPLSAGSPASRSRSSAPTREVDRRLSAVAEFDVPYYPGLRIGVPSLSAAVQTLAEGAFDVIHVCSPGPAGVAGALVSRGLGVPLLGSYHTELTAYAGLRSGERRVADAMAMGVSAFYGACDLVLSPSPASDAALAEIGVAAEKVARWDRGVDTTRFDPALRGQMALPGAVNVLYSGRITREKGADLLADAFLQARARNPRLRLVLAGGGPEQERLRERVGRAATFLGWLEGAELARAYASADIFLFPSRTDTFGQVILEAQASGLPVVAVAEGGPLSLIEDRVSGLLCAPDAERWRRPCSSSPTRRCCASASREPGWPRSGNAPGSGRSNVLARATGAGAETGGLAACRPAPKCLRSRPSRGRAGGGATCAPDTTLAARRTIAVALHDIEPATFERCALIRDWLDDHGVDRVTLLVIPARDLHPLGERSPEMTSWLAERRRAGDSIAQHGFQHEQLRRGAFSPPGAGCTPAPAARPSSSASTATRPAARSTPAGACSSSPGIEPDGFVAPAYAYTPALRRVLPEEVPLVGGAAAAAPPLPGPRPTASDARSAARPGLGHGNGRPAAASALPPR